MVLVLALVAPVVLLPFGLRTAAVTSGSMVPFARTGDAIVIRDVEDDEIDIGDAITFRPLREGGITTHRVVSVHSIEGSGLHFRTQGDANDLPDPNLVPAANVIGRVVTVVPRVGREYVRATTPLGRLFLTVIPALVIIGRELRWLLRAVRTATDHARVRTQRPRGLLWCRATCVITGSTLLVLCAPAAGLFAESSAVPSNAFTAGQLDAPANLNGNAQLAPCRVNLTWTAPAGGLAPDGYDILRSTTSGGPYSLRKHVAAVTSAADDAGPLAALTTYYYVVRATRGNWTSANSAQKSVTTLLCVL